MRYRIEELPTPAYVLDEAKLIRNLEILKKVQADTDCKILLAQKAFSMFCEYPLIGRYLAGTTASGLYEARLGAEEMGKENHIFSTAYRESEIDEIADICDHVIFNSFSQLRRFGERCRGKAGIGLRINPECSTQEEHAIYDPCAPGSRLGITAANFEREIGLGACRGELWEAGAENGEPLPDGTGAGAENGESLPDGTGAGAENGELLPDGTGAGAESGRNPMSPAEADTRKRQKLPGQVGIELTNNRPPLDLLDMVEGLHFHTLCEQNSDDLERTLQAVEEKFGPYLKRMKWLNMGGGHHITREDYDLALLERCIRHVQDIYGLEVYLEPGEAIALNAGYLVTTVMDIVENGITTLILDASAACHMPDVLEMPYRPPLRESGQPGEKKYTYRLSSCTCLAGDVIGDYSFDREIRPGDRLYFEDMAIYSMVKNNTFNGIGLPSIAVLEADGACRLVKQFGYEDFKTRLS